MKQPFFRYCTLLAAVLAAGYLIPANAQNYSPEKLEVRASAIYDGANVIIRWAPANYESWKWGNTYGYTLERMRVDSGGTTGSHILLDTLLKPMAEPQWQPLKDSSGMARVAFQLIFRDSLEGQYLAGTDFMNIYEAQQGRENLFAFCMIAADRELEVAIAAGLGYVDTSVTAGAEYVYWVEHNNAPAQTALFKGTCAAATASAYQLPPPSGLAGRGGDHSAVISWEGNAGYFTGYLIERSGDNGATWLQLNSSPYLDSGEEGGYLHFGDTLPANQALYVYRIKGCSPFGLVGPVSDTVHVYGKPGPLANGYPDFLIAQELTAGELTLNWEFPDSLESKIQGFEVYRASEQEGKYEKISASMLGAGVRSFVDDDPLPANYYKVVVTDANGHELASVPKLAQPKDATPPSPPASLSGSCNASGVATLHWSRSPEPDVMGYRVFMSNVEQGDFTQITTTWINDTTYRYGLNLNTLSEKVYFMVKAVDFRENLSQPSPVCTVQRPDVIPPAAPSIRSVKAEAGKVHFEWALSSSEDVADYKFQRKPHGGSGWETLLAFGHEPQANAPLAFTDSTASVRRFWDYRLLARDDAGLLSSSKVIKAKPLDTGLRDSITNFSGQLASMGNRVILEWDYIKDDPDLAGFQIYRSFDTCAMQSYRFITVAQALNAAVAVSAGQIFAFTDTDVDFKIPVQSNYTGLIDANTVVTGGTVTVIGTTVSVTPQSPNLPQSPQDGVTINYWVMAKYIDGGYSALSEKVEVEQ